jgi:hypothetical protein
VFDTPERMEELLLAAAAGALPSVASPEFFLKTYGAVDGGEPQKIADTRGTRGRARVAACAHAVPPCGGGGCVTVCVCGGGGACVCVTVACACAIVGVCVCMRVRAWGVSVWGRQHGDLHAWADLGRGGEERREGMEGGGKWRRREGGGPCQRSPVVACP